MNPNDTLEVHDWNKLLARYGDRYGQMSVEEYAREDAAYAASKIQPGSLPPRESEWTHYLMQLHVHPDGKGGNRNDFEFTVTNQQLYRRVFLEEYTRRYNDYFSVPD